MTLTLILLLQEEGVVDDRRTAFCPLELHLKAVGDIDGSPRLLSEEAAQDVDVSAGRGRPRVNPCPRVVVADVDQHQL